VTKPSTRITEEDFDAWKHNPITEAMLAHLRRARERARQFWIDQLQQTDGREAIPADPVYLAYLRIELRSKLEFIADIEALSLEDIQEDAGHQQGELGQLARQAAGQKGKGQR
jgi:hypothetical protein